MADYLRKNGQKVFVTHEPSDGPVGMLIRLALSGRLLGPHSTHDRDELLNGIGTALDPVTFALLFAADRMDHVESQILPSVMQQHHVVCDRYILSSLADQSLLCDLDWLVEINRHIIRPDLTIFLDILPEQATRRMRQSRAFYVDGIDEKLLNTRSTYLEIIRREVPIVGPVVVVDATRPVAEVTSDVREKIETFLMTGSIDDARGDLTLF